MLLDHVMCFNNVDFDLEVQVVLASGTTLVDAGARLGSSARFTGYAWEVCPRLLDRDRCCFPTH